MVAEARSGASAYAIRLERRILTINTNKVKILSRTANGEGYYGKVIKFHPLLPIPAMERGPKYAYRLRHDVIVSVVLLRKSRAGKADH